MRRFLLGVVFLSGLTACGGAKQDLTPASPPALTPYQTTTPDATTTPLPPLTELLLPTPTPVTYTVKKGDTMSAIALRYNITLDSLLSANPGVNPNILPIGTVLIIPIGGVVQSEPTPTPAAVTVSQAGCWQEVSGGLWCFALLENKYGVTIENLSALFTLLDGSGREFASETAFGLLDILPAGQAMPLVVHFPPPVPANLLPRVQVLTAILLLPGDTRYLPVTLQNILVQMDLTGRSAQVSGQAFSAGDTMAKTLWIIGTAFDEAGKVVGVRRWEASSPLEAGGKMTFSFTVSSVGPTIERVDLLVEARP